MFMIFFSTSDAFAGEYDDAELSANYSIVEREGSTFAIVNFEVTNNGNTSLNLMSHVAYAIDTQNRQFTTDTSYEMSKEFDCEFILPDVNPGLTESSIVCFKIPQNSSLSSFEIQNYPNDFCSTFGGCEQITTKFSTPTSKSEIKPTTNTEDSQLIEQLREEVEELKEKNNILEKANEKLQTTIDELQSKITKNGDSTPKIKKELASFVDETKDPQSYVDRYNNEVSYKEWFDENFPDYTIHEAVGKREPVPNWIKNNAIWWSEGKLSEDDFVNGIEYLVKNGIIKVD